jgi:NAD(P)-dependent dehydrogenase (short-subunit alcohol dehydrogenase family)
MSTSETLLVAGAGPRLGAAVARRFASEGWDVGLLARSTEFTRSLADELRDEHGTEAVAVRGDVTDPESVDRATGRVREALGPVECLVANAAAGGGNPIDAAGPGTFERVWRVRAFGSFLLVRACLSDLRATDGTVLLSGTTYATDPAPGQVEWASGAAAALGLARTLAESLDGVGVTYVRIGAAVRPPESDFPGAVGADEVARRYHDLAGTADPPADLLVDP